MKPAPESNQPKTDQLHLDEAAARDGCERFGAFHIGQRKLCPDCYQGFGSCCPELGKDDLWKFDDEV